MNKTEILNRLCYTELEYGRIKKKLKTNLSKPEIEELMSRVIGETDERFLLGQGKTITLPAASTALE